MAEKHELIEQAVGLLKRCDSSLRVYATSKKLARGERERLLKDIVWFLNDVYPPDLLPEQVVMQCQACKTTTTFTQVSAEQ